MKILLVLLIIQASLSQIPLKKKIKETYQIGIPNSAIPLTYLSDYNYYTEFQIGTPAQKMDWLQDTWVGETWINLNIANQTYQPKLSSTSNITTKQGSYNYTFGVGMVNGYYGTEVISLAPINLKNLKITILFGENGTGRGESYTGSVGLANNNNYKNWLEIAVQQKIFNDSMFAYDLRNTDYFYACSSSFPTGAKPTDLVWFSTLRENYWSMGKFTGTTINSVNYPQDANALEAVWDSGCMISYIGTTAFNGMLESTIVKTYCQLNPTYQIYICPCNQTYPNITLHTEKMDFKAISKDYMFELQGDYCVLGIIGNPESWTPFMIFGTSLFKNYFVAYDKTNSKIGFSKPKYSESENGQQQIQKFLEK